MYEEVPDGRPPIANHTCDLFCRLARLMKPPPNVSLSQWADTYRMLATESSAMPGKWRTDVAPYQRGIMDAVSDPATRKVVVMSAAQVGKTSILENTIGYYIHYDPSPMLVVEPTVEMGEAFSLEKLSPMIRDTPVVRERVAEAKSRSGSNTMRRKEFRGGFLSITGANSGTGLRMRSVRVLLLDEVDAYPHDVNREGSPIELAIARTTTFHNSKIVMTSTPLVKGSSNIEPEYLDSTQEEWHLPCPTCGSLQTMEWERLDFATVTMGCGECNAQHVRKEWLRGKGQWIARNPHNPTRGFHLSSLVSPWVTWEELIQDWRVAVEKSEAGDYTKLITFFNTKLGRTWEERGESIDETGLMARREQYYADVPDGVCAITIGVDTQDNRLCYEVVGWGREEESWGLEYGELWGDPRTPGSRVWGQLDEVLRKPRRYANGVSIPVVCACIDMGGHAADQVATYAKARQGWNVWAVRGVGGHGNQGKRFVDPSQTFRTKVASATGFHLAVDTGKDQMMARLRIAVPGPGYCHFPCGSNADFTGEYETVRGYDQRYFIGLTAEKKVAEIDNRGYTKWLWKKDPGKANEPFDCRNYASAALILSKVNLESIAESAPWIGATDPLKKPQLKVLRRKSANKPAGNIRSTQHSANSYTAV